MNLYAGHPRAARKSKNCTFFKTNCLPHRLMGVVGVVGLGSARYGILTGSGARSHWAVNLFTQRGMPPYPKPLCQFRQSHCRAPSEDVE